MPPQTLVRRVEKLEERVTILEELPARIDDLTLQISQLREEMRGEFAAVRAEIRAGDEETRRVLREEIHDGNERVLSRVRVLHEELVARFALIEEGRRPRKKRP
jgi:galactokinase